MLAPPRPSEEQRRCRCCAITRRSRPGALLLLVLILVTISIGGIVEIAPLFTIESTIEKVDGVRPYSPLELVGRNIYIREGCYNCHSQMIRPVPRRGRALRPLQPRRREHVRSSVPMGLEAHRPGSRPGRREVLRRLAGCASDRPAQRGAREHHAALRVPDSITTSTPTTSSPTSRPSASWACPTATRWSRPPAPICRRRPRSTATTRACRLRYPKAAVGDFDGQPGRVTEMDALVAYLQILGRMVDFTAIRAEDILR